MLIRELFSSNVTRDIAPVVYFHEQTPQKVAEEVREYIVTGGFPEKHPHHKRVPDGIHEQYVRLLRAMLDEITRADGSEKAAWISGFYGSGKSSFAKLLGLALDGVALPNGQSLAEAWLARDTSPLGQELKDAWTRLREKVDPIAVVFDIGTGSFDDEHIHSAVVRNVQKRLGYAGREPLVAEFELKLERDGEWKRFEQVALATLGKPWSEVKDKAMVEEEFSLVLSKLFPDRYTEPMAWIASRAGAPSHATSVEDAARAITDMLKVRVPDKTLFIVVDEVSQYIHQDQQRMLKLQSFVSELGARLRGRVFLLATGQQKLEESDDTQVLGKLKGRFKPALRVHLSSTNIRDVVHKRLLHKKPAAADELRQLFRKHRNDLQLFAYGCEDATEEDFVEVYPMLPGHIDLLLQITSALRAHSKRGQGDDQAIRGLLQLLGELFRTQKLADMPVGALVTLDQIYAVQSTALDADTQSSMARVLEYCAEHDLPLAARAVKAVALLELIQDTLPTDAKLVASCLFDRLDRGPMLDAVTEALEALRLANLLGYSAKEGYKIQSSSAEEWERERRELSAAREDWLPLVQDELKYLLSQPGRPSMQGRAFPWMAYFSDGRRVDDAVLHDPRESGNVTVDLRMLVANERDDKTWVNSSAEPRLAGRIVWLTGESDELESRARELTKSLAMVRRYKPRRDSLGAPRQRLLADEESRIEDRQLALRRATDAAFMRGRIYFRGRPCDARELGGSFSAALATIGQRFLHDLYPNFLATQLSPTELLQLIEQPLSAPSPKFVDELGILRLDGGKYQPECHGVAPRRVMELIEHEQGVSGTTLLTQFGGPPYGYVPNVVRACIAGLLRAGKVRIQSDEGPVLTAVRDAGVRDVFEKDRNFKRATFFPGDEGGVSPQDRARICTFFEKRLGRPIDREPDAIADAVSHWFPGQAERLRDVMMRLRQLPMRNNQAEPVPYALANVEKALEACYRVVRQTEETVKAVKRHLPALNEGIAQLDLYDAELTGDAILRLRAASDVEQYQLKQLEAVGSVDGELIALATQIRAQLHGERPWADLSSIGPALDAVRTSYVATRQRLLTHQGELLEAARARIKSRDGFAMLSAEHSAHVLRPLTLALPTTDAQAISPPLEVLHDTAELRVARAEAESIDLLDQLRSRGAEPVVRKLQLNLNNREITTPQELEALLEELRARVLEEINQGRRVRLV